MSQINQLKQLGLNENEAKTYLSLLKLGQTNISRLSSELSVPRTTLYYSIAGLKEKGFVFERISAKKRLFSARSPEFLSKKAQSQLELAKEINIGVTNLIPSLKKLASNPSSFSQVSHFEGKESVWEVFEIILRSNKDSYWFGFGQTFLENYDFDYFVQNFSKKRRQFGRTKSFNIIPPFEGAAKIARRGETDFQEFRFLKSDQDFKAGICIFGDKIAIFSYDNGLSATLIQGTAVAEIASTMFIMIWNSLE
ncbi:MAG: helix-turn-helix domain-containing protein [Patescibacteria group bacterium]